MKPDRDVLKFHPLFRRRAARLVAEMERLSIPLKLFEGFRTPERQAELFAIGRGDGQKVVTYAQPWESFHCFGLAADFVFFEDGKWHWRTDGVYARHWDAFRRAASGFGLKTLKFEKPHVQMVLGNIVDLQAGRIPAGDEHWERNLFALLAADPNAPELLEYRRQYV
jgi:hypothetical protein